MNDWGFRRTFSLCARICDFLVQTSIFKKVLVVYMRWWSTCRPVATRFCCLLLEIIFFEQELQRKKFGSQTWKLKRFRFFFRKIFRFFRSFSGVFPAFFRNKAGNRQNKWEIFRKKVLRSEVK